MIGQKISHYQVTDKLGEGGMGEVYRARDTKLGRDVAIKVLPAAFSADAERLRRFEQEAQAAGALIANVAQPSDPLGAELGSITSRRILRCSPLTPVAPSC